MSNIMRPVGPQPTRVYWVRRIVLLVVVLVALAAVIGAINKFTSGSADASDGGKESAVAAKKAADGESGKDAEGGDDAESTEGAKENHGTPGECADADIGLTLAVNKTSFGPDQQPEFSYELTNAGTAPCLIDVNEVTRTVEVTSGNDQIFSSGFCVKEKPRLLLLKENEVDAGKLTWDRGRNDAKCSKDLPAVKPGTYRAMAQIKGAVSDEVVFTLG